jgi:hypothetical protein
MLQVIEHLVDDADKVAGFSTHLINEAREHKPIAPSVLLTYEQRLSEMATRRERMRTAIAKWWSLLGDGH